VGTGTVLRTVSVSLSVPSAFSSELRCGDARVGRGADADDGVCGVKLPDKLFTTGGKYLGIDTPSIRALLNTIQLHCLNSLSHSC
jgi:hypothetical protein